MLQVFGGEDGKSRIFRSTMSHNRKQCVALYLEDEYEQLVLECYWTARARVKGPNNRYRFSCIHCQESHKDKNTTSYHRMFKLCRVYEGKPLKMYPTWDKSEQGEKCRIGLKFGKRNSPPMSSTPSPATRPPPLDLDEEGECTDAVSGAETSPPHSMRAGRSQSQKPSRKRPLPVHFADQPLPPPRKYVTNPSKTVNTATKPPLQPSRLALPSEEHPQQLIHPTESNPVSAASDPGSPSSSCPLQEVEFKVVRHTDVLPCESTLPMSRQDVERQAWAEARTLFPSKDLMVSPPPHMDINCLYILIAETDDQWAPKHLLNDPVECMQYLHKQLEDGTLGQRIGNAFGQWFLYGNDTVGPSHPF